MKRAIVVVVCSLGLWGCSPSLVSTMPDDRGTSGFNLASVFGSKKATLTVTSDPPGADAKSSPVNSCRTPCTLTFDSPGEFTVDVSRDGYVTQHLAVRVSAPEATGFGIPGSSLRLDPKSLSVQLAPLQSPTGKRPRTNGQQGPGGRG